MNNIKNDYAYCSGIACVLRQTCQRYPPDARLY
nr:MAG TPA: hypothetical protein [Caudoviricetes sp.]